MQWACPQIRTDQHGCKAPFWMLLDFIFVICWTPHLQNVFRKWDAIIIKYHKINLGASIPACFWTLEPGQGRPGDHLGMGTLKNTEKTIRGPSFGSIFVTFLDTCVVMFFYMISRPVSCCLFAPIGTHKAQFWRLWATKFGTDWANLEKWKHWFRARGSIKIKPQGGIYLYWFYHFHGRMFQTCLLCDSRPIFLRFFQIWVPFWTPFWTIWGYLFEPDFQVQKIPKGQIMIASLSGYPGHITE